MPGMSSAAVDVDEEDDDDELLEALPPASLSSPPKAPIAMLAPQFSSAFSIAMCRKLHETVASGSAYRPSAVADASADDKATDEDEDADDDVLADGLLELDADDDNAAEEDDEEEAEDGCVAE